MLLNNNLLCKLITSLLLIIIMSYSNKSDALTQNWDALCDIYWSGYDADFTQNQSVSGLKLQDSSINLQTIAPVWCYQVPDVKKGDESHLGLVADEQSSQGSNIELSDGAGDTIPINFCMGMANVNLLCVNSIGKKNTYSWGGGDYTENSPLLPLMFAPTTDNDPKDPCKSKGNCSRIFGPSGPFNNIAHINITLNDLNKEPIPPGIYKDVIKFTFNGQLASGHWNIRDLDITSENNPTFKITATVSPDCEIISAPDVIFSGYISSEMATTQNIQVRCTKNTPYSITFKGKNDNSSTKWHQMISTTNQNDIIQYQMYQDKQHTKPWSGDKTLEQTGTGSVQSIPIHYKTNEQQANQPAGIYNDTETLIITY